MTKLNQVLKNMNDTILELIKQCEGKHGQRFNFLKLEPNGKWRASGRPPQGKSKRYPDSPYELTKSFIHVYGANSAVEALEQLVEKIRNWKYE